MSDNRGRILTETCTMPQEPFTTMIATAPVHHETTLYQTRGDWFAWLTLALLAALLTKLAMRPAAQLDQAPAQQATVGN